MKISNKQLDVERALYGLANATVENCIFDGPADGESALKECKEVTLKGCKFYLRYPLWHVDGFEMSDCQMTQGCRAPLWYDANGRVQDCKILGVKALRECKNVSFSNCQIDSTEFGWKCDNITLDGCDVTAEYLLLLSKNVALTNVNMHGKYSFQYINNATIENCNLDTKDAFWHAKNVTVKDCEVKGEYLGWYAENLTFINCKIIGTQPLCYCKNLRLVNCTMEGCDLAFEYSQVDAQVTGHIHSVKNVKSGKIVADSIGEILNENSVLETNCQIVTAK